MGTIESGYFNCPYGLAATCEHAAPVCVNGEYQPCMHLKECNEALQHVNAALRSVITQQAELIRKLEAQVHVEGAGRV
jgi:hypothetical protein